MKKFALCLVLLSGAAMAQSKRDIYDLQYLPQAGTIFGTTTFANNKTMFGKSHAEGISTTQEVGYVLTNELSLWADIDYENSRTTYDGSVSERTHGLGDPGVNAKYRLMDSSFRLDVVAGLDISTGPETSGNLYSNNKNGGHVGTLAVDFGQKFEKMQWFGNVTYQRNFESKTRYTGGSKSTNDPYNSYNFTAGVLGRLAQRFNLVGRLIGVVSDPLGSGDRSTLYAVIYMAEGQFLVTDNFMVRAMAGYVQFDLGKSTSNEGNNFALAATYQF